MKTIECVVLVFTAILVFVTSKPQDVLFPDSQDSFPRPPPSPTTNPVTRPGSTIPAGSTTATTRIPPRDPGNRIVYIVSCPCNFTYEYSPVCGTDGQTYGNPGVLRCARQCGTKVDLYLVGACGKNNG